MSHPVWVRGLKREHPELSGDRESVAPRVGAWIETKKSLWCGRSSGRRTPCGCVD